jgi:acetyl/propionyl-CoA carboxylase alpha subunit
VARLSRALEAYTILGCVTNLPFLQAVARSGDFLAGKESTGWIQENLAVLNAPLLPAACAAFFQSPGFREALGCAFRGTGSPASGPARRFKAMAGHPELVTGSPLEQEAFTLEAMAEPGLFRLRGPALRRMLTGEVHPHERGPALTAALAAAGETDPHLLFHACRGEGGTLALAVFGEVLNLADPLAALAKPRTATETGGEVRAPMGGKVLEIHVAPGQEVEAGELLFVVESMKMQFEITAPAAGRVAAVLVQAGQVLQGPEALATLGA